MNNAVKNLLIMGLIVTVGGIIIGWFWPTEQSNQVAPTQQAQSSNQKQNQSVQKSLPDIVKEWSKSTAYIDCNWKNSYTNEWFDKAGSGLLIILDSVPTIITNKHVAYDENYGLPLRCDIVFPDDNQVWYSVNPIDYIAYNINIPASGQINFTADGNDIAYLSGLKEDGLKSQSPTISLEDRARSDHFFCDNNPPTGEPIVVLGYPIYGTGAGSFTSVFSKINPTATEGIISGQDDIYLTTSAKIDHGNSGGLAIDEINDCYIGMPTLSYAGSIESLGRILPASYIVK